ncbi:glycosyltransferase [Sphingomonas koreensis]|nr:glycosyltransferase [Sphingomonas koreensis]
MGLPPIAICIPVRNEAAELPRLFAALDRLERCEQAPLDLCLFLDGCDDDSAGLAEHYRAQARFRVRIEGAASATANAGRARRQAMRMGRRALHDHGGLLLTTDADSRPTSNWLTAMATALDHADVVAGRIVRAGNRPSPLQDRIERYYDALFALRRRIDPVSWEAVSTHHYTGAANMGFRTEAYDAIGGFAPLANGEDARLVDDAARAGFRVRRDAASVVVTSDRREGRVAEGLSKSLRDLDQGDAAIVRVAHPADAAWQYRMQAIARGAYADDRLPVIAAALDLSNDHVLGVARECPNAEAFAMRIVPAPVAGMRAVALAVAEAELSFLSGAAQAA